MTKNGIRPGGTEKVGTMTKPGSGNNWGWIFLGNHARRANGLQVYVNVGATQGIRDYAVQYYDGGVNRVGDTIGGTSARLGSSGGVVLEIGPDLFDPWMSELPDTLRLHQITLPGTHDSATHELPFPSKTQNATITEQLGMGVRYFDIRLDGDNFTVVHGGADGSGSTRYSLADVATMFRDFLTGKVDPAAVKETVVVQIKFDRNEPSNAHVKVIRELRAVFAGLTDHLHITPFGANTPTLEDLRGKLVVVRRYDRPPGDILPGCTPVDQFAHEVDYAAWSSDPNPGPWHNRFDAKKFAWPKDANDTGGYRNRDRLPIVLQDVYTEDAEDKGRIVVRSLEAARTSRTDAWFINFASAAPIEGPGKTAEHVNKVLTGWIESREKDQPKARYGTVLVDFATRDIVKALIDTNF